MEQYPLPIQEKVKEIISSLSEFIIEEKVKVNILEEMLCESLLSKFIAGYELVWDSKEMEYLLKLSITNSIIEELKSNGYLNSIEDENGEEWLWATEKGKEALELHEKSKKGKKGKKRK